jgi:hypothetical protein
LPPAINARSFFQIQKGVNGARADDTKSLKTVIIDWITPKGQTLEPPLRRNHKFDRGFNHHRTGALLCPAHLDWSNDECVVFTLNSNACSLLTLCSVRHQLENGEIMISGNDWPIFLYAAESYDPSDPWNGLFRGYLLVMVRSCLKRVASESLFISVTGIQTYFYFTEFC